MAVEGNNAAVHLSKFSQQELGYKVRIIITSITVYCKRFWD